MNRPADSRRHPAIHLARATVVLLAAATVGALASGDAEAKKRKHGRSHAHRVEVVRVVDVAPVVSHGRIRSAPSWRHARRHAHAPRYAPTLVAPVRIRHARDARLYREYRHGRVFHRGHGHWHEVYRFPVRTSYGFAWVPYDYCDGARYSTGYFAADGPRFHFSIRF